MPKQNTTESEALDVIREAINGVLGKRWMIAVWKVEEDEKGKPKTVTMEKRCTWNFPTGDFNKAMEQLRDSIDDETEALVPPVPPPLKMADFGDAFGIPERIMEEMKSEEPIPEKLPEPIPTIGEVLKGMGVEE